MEVPAYVKAVLDKITERSHEAYLVGGSVRDSLMGRTPGDYDIAVSCPPQITKACLDGLHVIETGIKHGTVTAVTDSHHVEITTFRSDGDYTDNRHPSEVYFAKKITDDLSRRDFTVNAIAYSQQSGIIDPFGGKNDIENRLIRCVGNPDRRFNEDGLRIMRAVRFASVLNFSIEEHTAAAVIRNRELLKNISPERIFTELKKLLCGSNAEKILVEFRPVFETLFPSLKTLSPDNYRRAAKNVSAVDAAAPKLAALLAFLPPEDTEKACIMLRADNKFKNTAVFLAENAEKSFLTKGEVIRFLGQSGSDRASALLQFRTVIYGTNDIYKEILPQIINTPLCLKPADLSINGNDLKALNITGKKTGETLNFLFTEVTEGRLENTRDALLTAAKKL